MAKAFRQSSIALILTIQPAGAVSWQLVTWQQADGLGRTLLQFPRSVV
jgi:hypothetical protein